MLVSTIPEMNTPQQIKITVIWVVEEIDKAAVSRMAAAWWKYLPQDVRFVIILKTQDPYINNFIGTHLYRGIPRCIVVNVPESTTIKQCFRIGENLAHKNSNIYITFFNEVILDKEALIKAIQVLAKDEKNEICVFKEAIGPSGVPEQVPFEMNNFYISKWGLSTIQPGQHIYVALAEPKHITVGSKRTDQLTV